MAAFIKLFGVVLMAVMPGGLVVLLAVGLGRLVAEQLKREAAGPRRLVRAVAHVRLKDAWQQARKF